MLPSVANGVAKAKRKAKSRSPARRSRFGLSLDPDRGNQIHMWNQQYDRPLVIGHRGAAGHAPENTLPSIERALELGVDAVEIDIHLVGEKLLVIHDDTVDRTTNGHGALADLRLDAIRSLDAGSGAQIPLLEEVLDLVQGRAGLVIEIKARAAVPHLASLLDRGETEAPLVISFDQPALVQFKAVRPRVQIAPLLYGVPHDLTACAERIDALAYNGHFKSMSQELVDDGRARGRKLFAFTPNKHEDIKRMMMLGVDAVTTDFPDRAFACIEAAAQTGAVRY